ncbi:hypothetical protein ACEQ8H_008094 [Pleosporales sp. CAS-2024a]
MKFSAAFLIASIAGCIAARPSTLEFAERMKIRQNSRPLNSNPVRLLGNNTADALLDNSDIVKKAKTLYGTNWAGIQLDAPSTGYYTSVTGRFTAPYPQHVGSTKQVEWGAMWVGIDGTTCPGGLLQGGLLFSVDKSGEVGWDAWVQFWPYNMEFFDTFDINSGDEVRVDITTSSPTKGKVTINNLTTHKGVSKTLIAPKGYPLCRQNVEWIVEDIDMDRKPTVLGNYTTVVFKHASAGLNTGITKDLSSPYVTCLMIQRHRKNRSYKTDVISDVKVDTTSSLTVNSQAKLYDIIGEDYRHLSKVVRERQVFGFVDYDAALSSVNGTDTRYQIRVSTGDAQYTGYRDKLSFRFLGIQYGSYPERFTYSSPFSASGELSALEFGSVCRQRTALLGSEDCLYLNIYTPFLPASNSTCKELKPVMLYIHGGAFLSGSGSDPVFDGGNLASRGDVVVVTINYRLGTFGFLVYGSHTGLNGNYGIGDMVTALEWVQRNIASFGGDPQHVTIFGQSAGAEGIRALLQSPPAAGLFTAAIMESDPKPSTYTHYLTRDEEVALQTIPILTLSGCATGDVDAEIACLRKYDAASFFNLSTIPASNPVVDGHYILAPGISFNGTGHINKVPLLMGNMRDEGASDLSKWLQTNNLTLSLASNNLPTSPAADSSIFPIPQTDNITTAIWNVTVQVLTESTFACLDQATAYAAANTLTFPELYYYQFNRSYQITTYPSGFPNKQLCNAPITPTHPYGDPDGEYYKCHSGDLTTVFGTWRRLGLPERDDNDTPFTQAVMDRWSSFGRTYNPNPDPGYLVARGYTNTTWEIATSGAWRPVTADSQTWRQLQWPSRQDSFTAKEKCTALGLPLDSFL